MDFDPACSSNIDFFFALFSYIFVREIIMLTPSGINCAYIITFLTSLCFCWKLRNIAVHFIDLMPKMPLNGLSQLGASVFFNINSYVNISEASIYCQNDKPKV